MPHYRYLFHDLLTNDPLAELELKSVSYEQVLNNPGSFSGQLTIAAAQMARADVIGSTVPGRTAIYVDRDGEITWGGILWKRRYQASSRALTLEGQTFESYLERRRLVDSLTYLNADQLTVMQSLISHMQSAANGDIGIEVGNETSGFAINAFFNWWDVKPYLENLQYYGGSDKGFDFKITSFRDTTTKLIRKQFEIAHPHLGATAGNTTLLWEYPGNIVDYSWDEDAQSGADQLFTTGANEGSALMVATATDQRLLNQGWPLLEDSTSYPDVTTWPDLDSHATADLAARKAPIITPTVSVYGDADPVLGTYGVGDFARFRILDDRFPDGMDVSYRVYGIKVNVDPQGARDKVDLTVGVLTP